MESTRAGSPQNSVAPSPPTAVPRIPSTSFAETFATRAIAPKQVSGKQTIKAAVENALGVSDGEMQLVMEAIALHLVRSILQAPRPMQITIDRGETSIDDD